RPSRGPRASSTSSCPRSSFCSWRRTSVTGRARLTPLILISMALPALAADPADAPAAPPPPDLARIAALYDEKQYDEALTALGDAPVGAHAALAKGTTLAAAEKLDEAATVLREVIDTTADAD